MKPQHVLLAIVDIVAVLSVTVILGGTVLALIVGIVEQLEKTLLEANDVMLIGLGIAGLWCFARWQYWKAKSDNRTPQSSVSPAEPPDSNGQRSI